MINTTEKMKVERGNILTDGQGLFILATHHSDRTLDYFCGVVLIGDGFYKMGFYSTEWNKEGFIGSNYHELNQHLTNA